MDILTIGVEPEKKELLFAILREFSFVKIFENQVGMVSSQLEDYYVEAVLESEKDIEENKVISHQQLKEEMQSWRSQ
jgi:hypothetical protein